MPRLLVRPLAPAVVAQRVCELLQAFPSAAIDGVRWQTLLCKYNERHKLPLDVAELGHGSALSAATALLWDVVRMVNTNDAGDPVVALEDNVVLTPGPCFLSSWPSLYQVLCHVVLHCKTGSKQETTDFEDEGAPGILLSQLKPLLQKHWHQSFDETCLNYYTKEGIHVRVKSMQDLLQAVLKWREERLVWQADTGKWSKSVNEALQPRLVLVPSKAHNDIFLRCALSHPSGGAESAPCSMNPTRCPPVLPEPHCITEYSFQTTAAQALPSREGSDGMPSAHSSKLSALMQEVHALKDQNARLRSQSNHLKNLPKNAVLCTESHSTPNVQEITKIMPEASDHSFQPLHEIRSSALLWGIETSAPASTATYASRSQSCGSLTPLSRGSQCNTQSGSGTPIASVAHRHVGAFVPMAFSVGHSLEIPSGAVQQIRTMFERKDCCVPSFFVNH